MTGACTDQEQKRQSVGSLVKPPTTQGPSATIASASPRAKPCGKRTR